MMIAVVGSGGKTTLIKKLAEQYRAQGKTVFVTTTTHMFIEADTLLTDDAHTIIGVLREKGYVMAGIPEREKINPLSRETFEAVCAVADVVLVEADGSKRLPLKFPNATEPVIPEAADEIIVVCGLNALGQKAGEVCHRLALVKECLGIGDDTPITPAHVQKLITEGYLKPLREKYPHKKITVSPRHDGTLYRRVIAALLQREMDVSMIREEWFCPQPKLILCGGGHVSREVAASADKALLEVTEPGTLCVIVEKHGSAPRGVGSMMFVGRDKVLGSIGGGEPEYLAICHAKGNIDFAVQEYALNNTAVNGLDMICGGTIKIAFIPLS